ncbi:hypothetical protein MFUL124B02_40330 [Myxococcus fulvus 124B02]|nr:hypothetical protein MFUL124B02_40330 [Myxococcus fulvus 124B02]
MRSLPQKNIWTQTSLFDRDCSWAVGVEGAWDSAAGGALASVPQPAAPRQSSSVPRTRVLAGLLDMV